MGLQGQIIRFIAVGLLASAVDVLLFDAGIRAGLPRLPCAVATFVAANVVNYFCSSRYVFHHGSHSWRAVTGFAVTVGIAMLINVGIVMIMGFLGSPWPVADKLVAGVFVLIWSFWSRRTFVFRKSSRSFQAKEDSPDCADMIKTGPDFKEARQDREANTHGSGREDCQTREGGSLSCPERSGKSDGKAERR